MILAAIFFGFSVISTTLIPLMFGMVLYRERRSIVTRMMLSGILSKLLFFWPIYFNIFVMWQSAEQTTYLPGFPFLWILGNIVNCDVFASKRFSCFYIQDTWRFLWYLHWHWFCLVLLYRLIILYKIRCCLIVDWLLWLNNHRQ